MTNKWSILHCITLKKLMIIEDKIKLQLHYHDEIKKLAFVNVFGLYEWLYLPFDLKNALLNFNCSPRKILNKYQIDFAWNYFDGIIVFSQDEAKKFQHLEIFDNRLLENLKLKLSKCNFVKINFLGCEVTNGYHFWEPKY